MFTTFSLSLKALLNDVQSGKIQLPDFQRGWVCIVVLGYGPQPDVERSPPRGEPLADHAEPAPVVERDRGVEFEVLGEVTLDTGRIGGRRSGCAT